MHKRFHEWLLAWKPIHLCWWFKRHNLPIPKYFIGGAAEQYQDHYKWGDDDNADPDSCSFDSLDTPRTGQAKLENIMLRIQVHDEAADSAAAVWNLYYNTTNNPSTATKVTTSSAVVRLVDGTPADGTATDDYDVVYDASGTYTWSDGEYSESDDSDKMALLDGYYTDLQWCIEFQSDAGDSTDYWFFARRADSELDGHSQVPKITTAAGGTAYEKVLSFSIAPTLSLKKQGEKVLGFTIGPTLSLKKEAEKALGFTIGLTAALLKEAQKILNFTIGPTLGLGRGYQYDQDLAFTIAPTCTLVREFVPRPEGGGRSNYPLLSGFFKGGI